MKQDELLLTPEFYEPKNWKDYAFLFRKLELVPTIVQDSRTKEVLLLAYMNEESFARTLKTGLCTFFSRSRQTLWCKGETSGNFLHVERILFDCDCDSLLVYAKPDGPACHTGNTSCFYRDFPLKEDKSHE